ncbi:MAG: dihydrofolate reductase family protein [Eubacteriales bacterium]|nr:dihydrofolate reductase family protein [Eubacteriales bacterium]
MAVYFYGCITLDGYLATKNHGLDWLYETGSPEKTGYDEFYRNMDVTLMGRRTFREIEKLDNPAAAYPTTENYVFTHRELDCPGFTPVNEDPVKFVRRFGQDCNIWVIGGNTILAPLLEQDMVDYLIVQVAPVLLGEGIPLFTQREATRRFRLENVKQYGQFAELIYSRAGCGYSDKW